MGPVRQNPIQRNVRTAHLSVLMTVHNFGTQYNTEQFSYLPLTSRHHSSDVVYWLLTTTLCTDHHYCSVPFHKNVFKNQ